MVGRDFRRPPGLSTGPRPTSPGPALQTPAAKLHSLPGRPVPVTRKKKKQPSECVNLNFCNLSPLPGALFALDWQNASTRLGLGSSALPGEADPELHAPVLPRGARAPSPSSGTVLFGDGQAQNRARGSSWGFLGAK